MDEEHSLEEKEAQKGKRTPWTLREFGGKTVWDWMGLLIVPLMLAVITSPRLARSSSAPPRLALLRLALLRLALLRAQDPRCPLDGILTPLRGCRGDGST